MTRFLRLFGVATAALAMLAAIPVSASAAATPVRQSPVVTQMAAATATIHGCRFQDFCIYSGTNFTGTRKDFFFCQQFDPVPFVGNGSWVNNQTAGTRAAFYSANKTFQNFTAPAFSQNPSKNWTPVFFVVPC
jgi:hypothetical protein